MIAPALSSAPALPDRSAPRATLPAIHAASENGPPAQPASTAPQTPPSDALAPAWLLIELDKASGRFVQTLLEPSTQSVLRRYPDENWLAFSRGVSTYIQAVRGEFAPSRDAAA